MINLHCVTNESIADIRICQICYMT